MVPDQPNTQQLPPAPTVDSWAPLLRLVPRADVVMGADIAKLRHSAFWSEQIERMRSQGDAKVVETLAAAATCGLDLHDTRRVVFAGNFTANTGRLIAVESPRIGEQATLDCLVRATKSNAEWRGATLVVNGTDHVLPQSSDVVVVVQEPWLAQVEAVDRTGRATPDPEIDALLGRADLGAGGWVVGFVPSRGTGTPFDLVRNYAVTLDTTMGLRIVAWMGVEPGRVDTVQQELEKQFQSFASALPALGLPDSVVRSVSFSNAGDGILVHASATDEDLRALAQTLQSGL
jgi:hypothetical protein